MKTFFRRVFICILLAMCFWTGTFLADRQKLQESLIRFHVVAASDAPADQKMKLYVRDAVLKNIEKELGALSDPEQAVQYLQNKLPYIQKIAADTLQKMGCKDAVAVTLQKELLGVNTNDTISLPAGLYQTLRITIGEGTGKNWWGVAFPEAVPKVQSVFAEEDDNGAGSAPQLRWLLWDFMERIRNNLFTP